MIQSGKRLSKIHVLAFVLITCLMFEAAYAIFTMIENIAQSFIIAHHINDAKYPALNVLASRVLTLFMLICLLKRFQQLKYQRILMSISLILLILLLFIPISSQTYPFISGISSAIFNLTEPWRQLFVPPAIRTTVEGFTEGLTSAFDLLGVFVEKDWSPAKHDYRYIAACLSIILVLFWWLSPSIAPIKSTAHSQSTVLLLKNLFVQYPYIFVASFLAGFNETIFSYSAIIAHEILPSIPGKTYQNIIYISGFLMPILVGPLADKYGIYLSLIVVSIGIMFIKLITMLLLSAHVTTFLFYYITVFFEAGFCASLWTLDAALLGERLRYVGIFRSFAICNIVFSLGVRLASRLYEWFSFSFITIQLTMALICATGIGILGWFYWREKNTSSISNSHSKL